MHVLVFQHIPAEHPGSFRAFMTASGMSWDAVELDAGDAIPPLEAYDALLVMGGPMNVWEVDLHPWLALEKEAIRRWVLDLKKPFLGVCLGHQLLADALGGRVEKMAASEVGLCQVTLTDAAATDSLFRGLPSPLDCLQWHGCGVTELPPQSTVIAASEACPVQAFRVGNNAWGIQFHLEVTSETVSEWGCIPDYQRSLNAMFGEGAQARLQETTMARITDLTSNALRVFNNFKALL